MFCIIFSAFFFSSLVCAGSGRCPDRNFGCPAGLPTVEGPKSSTDSSFYGQISGYLNDGVVLGGLILAAVAMLAVGNAIIATFAEVRDGKSTWAKFGMLCVVGVILIVVVIWLASKAATVLL